MLSRTSASSSLSLDTARLFIISPSGLQSYSRQENMLTPGEIMKIRKMKTIGKRSIGDDRGTGPEMWMMLRISHRIKTRLKRDSQGGIEVG